MAFVSPSITHLGQSLTIRGYELTIDDQGLLDWRGPLLADARELLGLEAGDPLLLLLLFELQKLLLLQDELLGELLLLESGM